MNCYQHKFSGIKFKNTCLLFAGLIYVMRKCTLSGVARGGYSSIYIPIINNLGGVIESNLSWIPPNPDQRFCDISPWIILSTLPLGLKIVSNLIHTPPSPHYIRVHILQHSKTDITIKSASVVLILYCKAKLEVDFTCYHCILCILCFCLSVELIQAINEIAMNLLVCPTTCSEKTLLFSRSS